VRVGADDRVWIDGDRAAFVFAEYHAGEVFEVDLVDDAGAGRHGAEVVERGLAPAEELVAFLIALELHLDVLAEGVAGTKVIDLDRVVDDEVDRLEWVNELGVASHGANGVPHAREVDHGGHAGEVLKEDTGGREGDFAIDARSWLPVSERFDVAAGNGASVFEPEEVFEEDAKRKWQAVDVTDAGISQGSEAVVRR